MDYWNDAYLPLSNVTDRFGGNLSVGGHIVLSLPRDFRARIGVSYWSDQAKGNDESAIQSLRISLTRFRFAAIYAPKPFCFADLQPYLGAEAQFLVINNNRKDDTRTTRQEGQDYAFGPLIGMEHSFNHFTAGLDLYNLGSISRTLSGHRRQFRYKDTEYRLDRVIILTQTRRSANFRGNTSSQTMKHSLTSSLCFITDVPVHFLRAQKPTATYRMLNTPLGPHCLTVLSSAVHGSCSIARQTKIHSAIYYLTSPFYTFFGSATAVLF